jgi:imidazolonepropionase-like amidohydrolase
MSDPAAAEGLVEGFVKAGYDQIKIYNELPREAYAALFDAAARHGIRVVGHVPFSVGIDAALAAGQYSIEHQRGYDYDGVRPQALAQNGGRNAERFSSWQRMSDDRMRDLVRKTVAAGTWNCPTFVVDDMLSDIDGRAALRRDPLLRFVHPEVRKTVLQNALDEMFPEDANEALRKSFPQKYKLLKMLSDAGAGLLVGTDTMVPYLVPGYTPIDEMQHFVKAGLTPYQALRAATSDPARFLGIDGESGTVGVGKRADLLLIEANPLEDLENLWKRVGVMLDGRWLPRAELEAMLERMAASYPSSP